MRTRARTGKDRLWARMGKDGLWARTGKDNDRLGQKELDANSSRLLMGLDTRMGMAQVQSEASPLHGCPGL